MQATKTQQKGYKGIGMEETIARWYARSRRSGSQIENWKRQAAQLTEGLPDGSSILEVAPGPGYFAIELARLGRFQVSALEISHTFVEIATKNAQQAGVSMNIQQGDASRMPFPDRSFDLIICQAAFKNFRRPAEAIAEMYRVLREDGTAIIQDMNKEVTPIDIRDEVDRMQLSPINAFLTRRGLKGLRRRAYTKQQFEDLATESPFGRSETKLEGITIEVRMTRASNETPAS